MGSEENSPDEEWGEERRRLRDLIHAEREAIGPAMLFAVVPLGLIFLVLHLILSEHAHYLCWLFIALVPVPAIWLAIVPFRHLWRSPMPLILTDGRRFDGAAKKRVLLRTGLLTVAVGAFIYFGPLLEARMLRWLRETLFDWRI